MKARSVLMFLLGISSAQFARSGTTYIPVVNGLFSTGQWYFDGNKSDLAGNLALTFVPAVRFSNSFSVLPTLQTNYRGTRSAEELAGGNTFFHDTWENGVNVKGVHNLNDNWSFKENAGYRFKWFRETVDETWNHGLYDYRIMNVGTEIERHWGKKASIGLGYDFSFVRFPNYVSLESGQSSDNAREFAGTNVLDNRIHLFSLRMRTPLFWKMTGSLQTFLSPRDYTDQHVVAVTGLLTETKRKDLFIGNNISLDRVFAPIQRTRLVTSVFYGYTSLDSNQNHYDATQTQFVGNYYDYAQNAIGTQLTFAFGSKLEAPMLIDLGYSYSHRNYTSRVIQSQNGTYMNEKLSLIEQNLNLGFSYPLSRNFRVKTTTSFGQSKSNNNYEQVYQYNYHNAEYQFGFTYDY